MTVGERIAKDAAHNDFIAQLSTEYEAVRRKETMSKRAALRIALAQLIESGVFAPGEKIPPEVELTAGLSVSLGTVQAALQQLHQLGVIERQRGTGTRVSDRRVLDDRTRHFRFLSPDDGSVLTTRHTRVTIRETQETGPWTEFLGGSPRYILIERDLVISASASVLAQMYLDAGKFPTLASEPEVELKFTNIREWLGVKFGLKTIRTSNRVAVIELTEDQATAIGAKAAGHYYKIHATAFSADGSPVYFQQLLVPVSACILEF